MAKIVLRNGGLPVEFDNSDLPLVSEHEWSEHHCDLHTYASAYISGKKTLMHQMLCPGPGLVDHKNGNGLDNRRENLRQANKQKNARNSVKRAGVSSRHKGVYWHAQRSKWAAQISVDVGVRRALGLFKIEDEAGLAYDSAARELFGEFAALNFPRPGERKA